MTVAMTKKGGVCRLKVKDDMTIYQAVGLKDELLKGLEGGKELEVSLAEVAEMDSAGFQLMFLLKREGLAAGKPVRFLDHSPVVLEVLDTFNMASYFGDPLVLPSGTAV